MKESLAMPCTQEQPKKYRFKTQEEFEATCKKDSDGDYIAGTAFFTKEMFYLFGKVYNGTPDNLVGIDRYNITPEMIVPIEQPKTKDMKKELENIVVDNLNREFGKEIIETWKLLGVDTGIFAGNSTKKENNRFTYYGLINGRFNNYAIDVVKSKNAKIITIEELKGYLPLRKQPAFKLTITRTELLDIYQIACDTWKKKILEYGKRLDLVTDTITFTESEVQEMFKAATIHNEVNQKEVLERIFGNPRKAELTSELETLQARIEEIKKELDI